MGDYDEFDVAGDVEPRSGPSATDPAERAPGRRRRPPWLGWSVASAALVVAGVVVAPAAGSIMPPGSLGLMVGLDEPLAPDWSAELGSGPSESVWEVLVVEDRVLVTSHVVESSTGTITETVVRGFDASSGEVVWEHRGFPLACDHPVDGSVVCVGGGGPEAEVRRIDIGSGAARSERVPGAVAATELDGDLVLLRSESTGTHVVRFEGTDTGAERWSRAIGPSSVDEAWFPLSVTAVADVLVVAGSRNAVLDPGSGDLLLDNVAAAFSSESLVVVLAEPPGAGAAPSYVYVRGSDEPVELPPGALPLWVDDDPRSGLAFSSEDGTAAAVSAPTGDVLWRLPHGNDTSSYVVARHRGVAVVERYGPAGGALLGLDVRTGEELWEHEAPGGGVGCLCYAGGGVVLTHSWSEQTLRAVDVLTGETRWVTAMPSLPAATGTDGRRLAMLDQAGVLTMWVPG